MILFLFLMILAYLMGSINSAIIVCRLFSLPDPRVEGSKNPGATNVLRLAGKQYAAYVIIGDMLKGALPVLIAKYLHADTAVVGFTALAAVIGHIYPIFFNFEGGKGVATAIGAFFGFNIIFGTMVAATWIIIVNLTRYSSLASLIAIALAPLYSLIIVRGPDLFPPLFFIVILVVYKHRNNLTRLMEGTEPKLAMRDRRASRAEDVTPEPATAPAVEPKPKAAKKATKKPAASKAKKPVKTAETDKKAKPAATTEKPAKATKAAKPAAKKPSKPKAPKKPA